MKMIGQQTAFLNPSSAIKIVIKSILTPFANFDGGIMMSRNTPCEVLKTI